MGGVRKKGEVTDSMGAGEIVRFYTRSCPTAVIHCLVGDFRYVGPFGCESQLHISGSNSREYLDFAARIHCCDAQFHLKVCSWSEAYIIPGDTAQR